MSDIPRSQSLQAEQLRAEELYRLQQESSMGRSPMSGWLGWLAFASTIMALFGTLSVVAGLVTLFRSWYYEVNTAVLAVDESWTALGWTQLILGAIVVGAALALLRGHLWARIVAVLFAMLTIVENFLQMAASPVWNLLLIALAVTAIYAIVVHGRDDAATT